MEIRNNFKKAKNKVLKEFKQKLLKELNGNLLLVKIFGSWATGKANLHSDIDLLIVVQKKERYFDKIDDIITDIELELMDKYGVFISSTIYGLKEYKTLKGLPTNFMYWVEKEGINLWQATGIRKI